MPLPFESGRKIVIMPKRIPEETKQRAIRLVLDHLDEYPNLTVACETVSARLGFGAESLRRWVRRVSSGGRRGRTVESEATSFVMLSAWITRLLDLQCWATRYLEASSSNSKMA
jgi:transposase-like protein